MVLYVPRIHRGAQESSTLTAMIVEINEAKPLVAEGGEEM